MLVSARAGEASRLLRVPRADFRRLVSIEADIGEIVMRAFILRRVNLIRHVHGGVVVIGPAHTADTLRLIQFLSRNAYPHRLVDTEHDAGGDGFLDCLSLGAADLPVVIAPGHRVLRKPSLAQLADDLGLTETFDHAQVFDLAVVGAGPAGLAAAVYGASEGLQTIVIESMAPGGQAGTSSKIENYLGFPTGISGQALAGRAQVQAQKFGARLALSRAVVGLDCERAPYTLKLEDGESIRARAIVIATGARYRKLDVADYERFEGAGIYYAATAMEADLCAEQEIVVVGGGNSAGQAAVFLARSAKHVHMLCRAKGLAATMSDYLVQRIERSDRITLHPHSEVTRARRRRLAAERHLDQSGERRTDDAAGAQHLRDDRRRAEHAMGGGLPRARRAGLHLHRRQSRRGCRFTLCDVARGRLRGRRRPLGVGQARRLRRRRRLGRGPGHPPLPEPGAGVTGQ